MSKYRHVLGHVQKGKKRMNNSVREQVLTDFLSVLDPYPLNSIVGRALRFCFRNPYEGLIIVDKKGLIQFMDRPTEKYMGLQQGGAQGVNIRDILGKSDFELTITTGKPVIGTIGKVAGVTRIASVYPLKKDGELMGAIGRVAFHPFEEIEKQNKEIQELRNQVQYFRQRERDENSSLYTFDNILGSSRSIKEAITTAKRISMLATDTLIMGESGTGKELFAHSMHGYSCPDRPFVKINCPAIPFELAESQLFGYEKGAFTGASATGKAGVFEVANNGVVFLDEISSLPLSLQAKLLRVLQEREVQRLGSSRTKRVNFRFIAATNVELHRLVEEGNFREDLYYRIARAILRIPPLRERREDILLYLDHFLETINKSFKISIKGFSSEATQALLHYGWPGNVRQLIHILEQTAITVWDKDKIFLEDLPKEIRLHENHLYYNRAFEANVGIKQEINYKEKAAILSMLRQTKGNKRQAAILLKMPRSTFYQKIKRYGIKGDEHLNP
jgi:transcriptional regulator with PAS, ATPase and Fis domain